MESRKERFSLFKKPTLAKSYNLTALKSFNFRDYLENLPSDLLTQLSKYFPQLQDVTYTAQDFLQTFTNPEKFTENVISLLQNPFDYDSYLDEYDPKSVDLPTKLEEKVDLYILLLNDVLSNQLAQRPYEQLKDQENVTELEHAIQAGKFAFRLGFRLDEVLSLLFHDIARPSVDDVVHGHKNHTKEGSIILAPLGLSTDYALHHGFAKYLLYKHCPLYRDLISPLSKHTLEIQTANVFNDLEDLKIQTSDQLAKTIFKLLLMRLIDDCAKVPNSELREDADQDLYWSGKRELVVAMLTFQININLNKEDVQANLEIFEQTIDESLKLLLRAQAYSNNPDLYEEFSEIIDELRGATSGIMLAQN